MSISNCKVKHLTNFSHSHIVMCMASSKKEKKRVSTATLMTFFYLKIHS